MNNEINTIYKNEQIDFVLNNNLKFFLITQKSNRPYQTDSKTIQIQKTISDVNINNNLNYFSDSSKNIIELTDKNDILKNFSLKHNQQELAEKFFYIFYNKYPKYRKEILTEHHFYFKIDINKDLDKFIENTSKNKKEAINNILNYPISVLNIKNINFKNCNNKLKSMGCDEEDLFYFWFNFFKLRKNQIKNPKASTYVADFISEQFSYEKLELFFPFFPYLEAKYKDVEPNIFDSSHKFSVLICINLKKISTTFPLRNWSYQNFENTLKILTSCIKNHYKLEEGFFSDISRAKKLFNMCFFHNNNNFDKELCNKRIIQFFNFLKKNPKEYKDLSESVINNWIYHQELTEELSENNTKKTKKIKL